MSEEQDTNTQQEPTELDLLKMRADAIGVTYSNNIGVDTLKERIAAKLNDTIKTQPSDTDEPNAFLSSPEVPEGSAPVKKLSLRQHLINENMKLVRCRITCMDPKKKDLGGEILTVANEYLGTVKKFVPFGEATEDGFHVPYCLYKFLEGRKFLQIRTTKDKKTGHINVSEQWVREFSLEVLPQLTQKELNQLGTEQQASGRIN